MGRIRTIKPELALHEGLYDLEADTGFPIRFAWAMLPTQCDREGRFKWKPRRLQTQILPYDPCDFADVLNALHSAGFLQKYRVAGELFGCIPTFLKHQSPNQREAQSSIPGPDHPEAEIISPDEDGTCAHVHAHALTPEEDVTQNGAVPSEVNVPGPLREAVLARDAHACVRCGATKQLTVDHIFPRSMGGTHAPSNLRTLCGPCSSARPVAGKAFLDDLARDGLSLDDMPRICMHVHASGERKGKEGKGTGKEGKGTSENPPADSTDAPLARPEAAIQSSQGEKWGSADDLACAKWIYAKLQEINPTQKEPNWVGWANDVRLMRERDGRSHRAICELFGWANADGFWQANILSPAKLRTKWDQLVLQRSRAAQPRDGPSPNERAAAEAKRRFRERQGLFRQEEGKGEH